MAQSSSFNVQGGWLGVELDESAPTEEAVVISVKSDSGQPFLRMSKEQAKWIGNMLLLFAEHGTASK